MEISVLGRNLKVTPQLEDYTLKKVNRLDRFLPNIAEIRVEYERQHTRRGENLSVAQITVRHKRGAILRSQETVPGEMEHALNQAIDKMYRQIQRFKGKRSRKGRER
ncbi:MAG: ribosome-associated translation inhibitor RaiA, partial [Anaerolinea sp.]|nr:ribosome-associated translation inhibitor RaiA [Anaerolinea sp.]